MIIPLSLPGWRVAEFQLSALIGGLATDQENKDRDYIYHNGA